jgi:CubicO group peptidase (beta-lactamase class C family)
MIRRAAPVAVAALCVLAGVVSGRGETAPGRRDISGLLETQRREQDLPAVAAIVIEGDRVAARGVAGVRKAGETVRARPGDRWHIGSCTKAITATLVAVLVEKQVLAWDLTIADALPDIAAEMRPEYRDVTIEMLLANRGGIAHEWDVPGLWDVLWKREGTPVEERRKMTRSMLAHPPKVPPGEYAYANCGYGIAGHMAETVAGKPWETLVREHVFRPLGMRSAGFGITWDDLSEPWPHDHAGKPIPPSPFADNPPSIGPGGTIHVSLDDWAKFAIEHLKGARGEDGDLLEAEAYARLHRGREHGSGKTSYALGWFVFDRAWAKGPKPSDTGRCLHHGGSNNSWFALAWIAPERNLAVLCATNIGGGGVFPKIDAVIAKVIAEYQANPR